MRDLEDRRKVLTADLDLSGESWRRENAPGSAGCHELLDRTAMVADLVERYLIGHPACIDNPAWFELATEAAERLQALYQQIGHAHLGAEETEKVSRR